MLTGGIAYAALFSVFAALTIGYTIFMAVLGSNDELRQRCWTRSTSRCPGSWTPATARMIDPDSLCSAQRSP